MPVKPALIAFLPTLLTLMIQNILFMLSKSIFFFPLLINILSATHISFLFFPPSSSQYVKYCWTWWDWLSRLQVKAGLYHLLRVARLLPNCTAGLNVNRVSLCVWGDCQHCFISSVDSWVYQQSAHNVKWPNTFANLNQQCVQQVNNKYTYTHWAALY